MKVKKSGILRASRVKASTLSAIAGIVEASSSRSLGHCTLSSSSSSSSSVIRTISSSDRPTGATGIVEVGGVMVVCDSANRRQGYVSVWWVVYGSFPCPRKSRAQVGGDPPVPALSSPRDSIKGPRFIPSGLKKVRRGECGGGDGQPPWEGKVMMGDGVAAGSAQVIFAFYCASSYKLVCYCCIERGSRN